MATRLPWHQRLYKKHSLRCVSLVFLLAFVPFLVVLGQTINDPGLSFCNLGKSCPPLKPEWHKWTVVASTVFFLASASLSLVILFVPGYLSKHPTTDKVLALCTFLLAAVSLTFSVRATFKWREYAAVYNRAIVGSRVTVTRTTDTSCAVSFTGLDTAVFASALGYSDQEQVTARIRRYNNIDDDVKQPKDILGQSYDTLAEDVTIDSTFLTVPANDMRDGERYAFVLEPNASSGDQPFSYYSWSDDALIVSRSTTVSGYYLDVRMFISCLWSSSSGCVED